MPSDEIDLNDKKYTIKSVIIHSGHGKTSSSGHYTAALKDPNGDWILCDDLSIMGTHCPMDGYIFFL